jgi:hypothetical protein
MRTLFADIYALSIEHCLMAVALAGALALAASPSHAQQQDLSESFQRAAEDFRPVTEDDLAGTRSELIDSMTALERFVRPSSPNGERWLRYLHWNELKDALSADGPPDASALRTTYQQLNRDENGLELRPFRRVADALLRYNQLLQLARQADQQQYYRSQLERLQAQLEEYRGKPSPATASEIGSRLGFVAGVGNTPELVRAIRQQFARPNAYVEVATELVAAGVDPIDRNEWITDCILGTFIRGDTHSEGNVRVVSIPSDDKAVLEFNSKGRSRSYNRGTNGPAVIRSTSRTDFTARKRVEFSDQAFVGRPSRAHADTDTHLQSISKQGGGLGSRLVSNIGWKRARQSERQAEAIASDHAEDRIERRFNDEVNEKIRDARKRYEDEYRRPLERRGELPEHIRFHSDEDSLGMEVAQASGGQLGAPGAPPEAPAGHDMTMRLHETAVNNYSASLLGGATATETEPGEDLKFDVKMPKWMKEAWEQRETTATDDGANQPFKPYSLTFREGRPLTANFVDGQIKLTIHIARLRSGDNTFANWDVTGTYTPELADGGIRLRREGDLVMLPANFRGQLSSRQVAERSNLEKELNERSAQGRGFPKEIEFDALQPEGALADAGPLVFNEFDTEGGWLTVAWDRQ